MKILKYEKWKVGDTPLIRCPALEKIYGINNLWIKDESRNQFGTFKDRKSKVVIEESLQCGVNKLVIITFGNAGYSLARFAEGTGIKVVCVIDKDLNFQIKEHLRKYSELIELDLKKVVYKANSDFECTELVEKVRKRSDERIKDVTHGYHKAFRSIIEEIKKSGHRPDLIITPLGSGEAFVGLYEGLKNLNMKTRLVGVGVHHLRRGKLKLSGKPSIADKLYTPYTPYEDRINDILEEGHLYIHVSEKEIKNAYNTIKGIIRCEPSSAAAFASLHKLKFEKGTKVMVINSGKGIFEN